MNTENPFAISNFNSNFYNIAQNRLDNLSWDILFTLTINSSQ